MQVIAVLFGVGCVAAWFVAAVSGLQLALYHRAPNTSFAWYAVRGAVFLSAESFAPSGEPTHQRMIHAILAFAGFALAGFVTVLVGSAMSAP